ncbi:hypothetical protein KSP40_PGU019637 [Platanthera guangdongensis]|uniref:Uncharacterized protein n=1 Tax=Platanthera guangdongensis TaxID=2320717 RepID=A0ABR2LDB5_9ASPA
MRLSSLLPNPNHNLTFPPYPLPIPARRSFSAAVIGVPDLPASRLPMAGLLNPCLRSVRSETTISEEDRSHTMMEFLGKTRAVSDDFAILISHLEYACK